MTNLLKIEDLHVSVGDKKILDGIDLEVNKGEVHVVMGSNGSGKSWQILSMKLQMERSSLKEKILQMNQ